MTDLTLVLQRIEPHQVEALAQFAKLLMFDDIRSKAVDDEEAYAIRDAVEKLQTALADVGYGPR